LCRVLIEVPTWLGDCIMATPAIENIVAKNPNVKFTIFGSFVSTTLLKAHPNVEMVVLDESKRAKSRFLWIYKKVKSLGEFDYAITFRRTLFSRIFIFFANAKRKGYYRRYEKGKKHLTQRYNDFVNRVFKHNLPPKDLKIYIEPTKFNRPTLGINPGATYGSAKRWYPEEFAKVASHFSNSFDIIIFGGPNEVEVAKDIEKSLKEFGITNYQNLAGKTTIEQLCSLIGGCNLFITNDSGPMHIAAAYKVPTVAIFGPTKDYETSQWQNPKGVIVKKEIECAPCMKRECPLKHHECMKSITAQDVIKEAERIL